MSSSAPTNPRARFGSKPLHLTAYPLVNRSVVAAKEHQAKLKEYKADPTRAKILEFLVAGTPKEASTSRAISAVAAPPVTITNKALKRQGIALLRRRLDRGIASNLAYNPPANDGTVGIRSVPLPANACISCVDGIQAATCSACAGSNARSVSTSPFPPFFFLLPRRLTFVAEQEHGRS